MSTEEREPATGDGATDIEAADRPAPPPPPPPAPPAIVDGVDHRVDPRSVRLARLIAVPLTIVIPMLPLGFITLGWAFGGIPTLVYLPLLTFLLILAGLAATIAVRLPAARHRHLRYQVYVDGLRIQHGVLWRKTAWIPITRVQHTDVSQGPLERKFGLATLTVYTAGTEGASIPLPGLEHGVATRLSAHLRPERPRDGA